MAARDFKGCPITKSTFPKKVFSYMNYMCGMGLAIYVYIHIFGYIIIHYKFMPHLCYLPTCV